MLSIRHPNTNDLLPIRRNDDGSELVPRCGKYLNHKNDGEKVEDEMNKDGKFYVYVPSVTPAPVPRSGKSVAQLTHERVLRQREADAKAAIAAAVGVERSR